MIFITITKVVYNFNISKLLMFFSFFYLNNYW